MSPPTTPEPSVGLDRPRIGVTRCESLADYLTVVEAAGGRPCVLHETAPDRDRIDALLLTGGGDLQAARYRARPHPAEVHLDPARDEFELETARHAMAADLPILGICRGLQVLNVLLGGTLIQDIPSLGSCNQPHQISRPKDALAHWVRVRPNTRLAALLQRQLTADSSCRVNSRHHQAPARIGSGLRVVATAPDGIVEALEHDGRRLCLGVQWHPENFWRTGEFADLFEGFVRAATGRSLVACL